MPVDIRLTEGDIVVDPFDIQLNEVGLEAIAQRLAIRLRAFQGEYFLDTSFGTPWMQNIFVKNPSQNLVDTLVKKVIIETPGIEQLISFSSEITPDRCLSLVFRARIEDQIVEVQLVNDPEPLLCIYQAPPGNDVVFQFPLGGVSPSGAADLDFNC